MKHFYSRLLPFFVSIAVVIGFFIGSFYGRQFSSSRLSVINTSSNKLSDLLHIINERYVDTINMGELVDKALPQILKELDPHSSYVSAKDAETSMQELKGSFSGIGVQFTIYEDTIRVVKVIEGGPSKSAGLRPGDRIVTIDGKTYVGKDATNDTVMKHLKGASNSVVELGIKRSSQKELQQVKITRGEIPVKSVDVAYMIDQTTGYLRINTWGDKTYAEVLAAMASLTSEGMSQLIIDLRGNLGGYLQASVQVANEFLPQRRLIVYHEGRGMPRENYSSDGRGAYIHLPLVVLVDETSASASEIFAGAMQDNDRAMIVGRRTFGKGLVQVPIQFRDGSILRLTTARYYTPSGRCLQKPFIPGQDEAYEAELMARAEHGEYFSSDSIKMTGQKYKTRIGRIVYGGGGIVPDYFVPRDTLGITNYYRDVYLDGTMYRFAYWYVDKHRSALEDLEDGAAVVKYLKKTNIVEQFAVYAEKHGNKRRNLQIKTSHKLLQDNLISFILGDTKGLASAMKYLNVFDPFVLKANTIFRESKSVPQKPQFTAQKKTFSNSNKK